MWNKVTYYHDPRVAADFAADSTCSGSQFIVDYAILTHFLPGISPGSLKSEFWSGECFSLFNR